MEIWMVVLLAFYLFVAGMTFFLLMVMRPALQVLTGRKPGIVVTFICAALWPVLLVGVLAEGL
jgi:hypothetical protein